jgi:DNA-binding NarL/FixJ family response regulator
VLVVDDHAVLAQAMAIVLEQDGMAVEVATDVRFDVVLARADRWQPDVVVLDLYLSSDQVSLPLIAPLTRRGARVLILTAAESPEELAACLNAGAVAVLPKGEPLKNAVAAVLAAFEGRAVRAAQNAELLAAGRKARAEQEKVLEPFDRLTAREQEVLAAIMAGKSAEQIAREHDTAIRTVRSHLQAIRSKLGVRSQVAAVALAREAGWPGPRPRSS